MFRDVAVYRFYYATTEKKDLREGIFWSPIADCLHIQDIHT